MKQVITHRKKNKNKKKKKKKKNITNTPVQIYFKFYHQKMNIFR